jgi:hypothetical protein
VALPPVWRPHQVVILGIDSAAQSGWGIWRPGSLRVGVIRDRVGAEAERCQVVEAAIAEARAHGLGLIVLGEKWTAGGAVRDGKMHASTLLGLGAAWRDWERVLRHYRVPRKRLLRVNVKTWQGAMLKGLGARTSAELKAAAKLVTRSRFPGLPDGLAPDAYDAGCIVLWGGQSGEVGHALASSRLWPTQAHEPLVHV